MGPLVADSRIKVSRGPALAGLSDLWSLWCFSHFRDWETGPGEVAPLRAGIEGRFPLAWLPAHPDTPRWCWVSYSIDSWFPGEPLCGSDWEGQGLRA